MLRPIGESLGTDQLGLSQTSGKCATCGGVFVRWLKDGKPIYSTCPACRKTERDAEERRQLELALPAAIESQRSIWEQECGIPLRFINKTFANFKPKLQPKAYAVMNDYVIYDDGEDRATSVILLSPNAYGVGKTHLVAALVNRLIETEVPAHISRYSISRSCCPVLFITESELLGRIRATFEHKDDGESESRIYQQLANVNLLIIDDVGKVRPHDYSFLQGVYFRVMDARYTGQMPVILTTNLGADELEAHIGGASADRLREMCGPNIIIMVGKSYRITAAK